MNVVDSSAWLEYFADGPNARFFAAAIVDEKNLAVPTICIAEVFRRMLQQLGLDAAMRATAAMQRQGAVIELDVFCLMGNKAEALGAMAKSHAAGFRDANWARRDPDLAMLHDEPEFQRLFRAPPDGR